MGNSMKSKLAILAAVVSLASCGAATNLSQTASDEYSGAADMQNREIALAESAVADSAKVVAQTAPEADRAQPVEPPADPAVTESQPQLIKQAQLNLVVESVDEGLKRAAQLIRTQQGDILELQDNEIEDTYRTAYMRIRVPQANLDRLLENLSQLGTVKQQGLRAEDVSTQIVDAQARLRNLRKSEESLLKIMERSGEISHVLEVSRELSNIRGQIEQIDAQVKNLQARVRYSTIDLQLAAARPAQPTRRPLIDKISATWEEATQSVGDLTVSLLQLGLWLLAYSPYLLVVSIAGVVGYRVVRRPRTSD
ncbi:MAG: DUF4349 domain-containing protein [Leptolyngbyaceae cyanobacterium MAG.088]|nr:DUF4349 domain-containing protein [Leptolyngbyaceae cyanobacterium MAG.088]